MEERNNRLSRSNLSVACGDEINQDQKLTYLKPMLTFTVVSLESHIAGGSITVRENDNVVEESWMVEEDDVRTIDLDFFD